MRILHVNKFLSRRGGAEAYMLDLAELQQREGHDVSYFAMQHPDNQPSPYASHFPPQVDLNPIPPSPVARVATAIRMIHSRPARRGIERVLDDARPDVVHLHNIYHQLSPSILGPIAARRIPALMTLHDYKLTCPTYRFLANGTPCTACVRGGFHNAIRKRCQDGSLTASALLATETAIHARTGAYGSIRLFLCPSRFLLDKMVEGGVYPHRMRHLENFALAPAEPARHKTAGLVLFAGRLSPEKGVDVLVRAAALLGGGYVEIAGDGPARADLECLARQVAPGRVRFLGRLERHDVQARMLAAQVVVLPARWYENQPMSMLEAMAAGTAVVVTAMGGLPELVEPGRTGAVIACDDPHALAGAIDRFIGDPSFAAAAGAAAQRVAATRFAPSDHVARVTALYNEAAAM